MPTSQIQEVATENPLWSPTDTAFGADVSDSMSNVEEKCRNPVLQIPFIYELHNRGSCRLSFAISDRNSKRLANSLARDQNRKTIHYLLVCQC